MQSNTTHMIIGAVLFAVGVAFGYGLAHKYPLAVPPLSTYSRSGGGTSSSEGDVQTPIGQESGVQSPVGSHEGPIHAGETNGPKRRLGN
jgi:hypothetical protein